MPGEPHHVTQRGNRCQRTFFGDEDYAEYLALMAHWCERWAARSSWRNWSRGLDGGCDRAARAASAMRNRYGVPRLCSVSVDTSQEGVVEDALTVTTDVPGEESLTIPVYAHVIAEQ